MYLVTFWMRTMLFAFPLLLDVLLVCVQLFQRRRAEGKDDELLFKVYLQEKYSVSAQSPQ